ncbi:TIGR02450 family Trp-rich protein [Methylosoma difficile]
MPSPLAKTRINPEKLLLSKWTAVTPRNKEKHFLVTKLIRDDDNGQIIACLLEAVINKNEYQIDWRELQESAHWQQGWQ